MSLLSITAILSGMWRAVLFLPSGELPFQMEFSTQNQQSTAIIINASERIVAKEISYSGDSIFIRLPLYDSEIRAQINGNRMTGTFYNYNRADKNQIPFAAEHGLNYRFKPNGNNNTLPGKKWQILFGENKIAGYDAIGIFENKNQNTVWATFVIGSGDHRFLEGNFDGDSLFLSCFDGSHAFMYRAKIFGDSIRGIFYSGMHWAEPFEGKVNDQFELNDELTKSTLKAGEEIKFYLPDMDGEMYRFGPKQAEGKVTVIQILGSWCPNCIDESAYYAEFEKKYRNSDLQFIGIAFEKTQDFEIAQNKLKRLTKQYAIEYPILFGGSTAKEDLLESLPFIEKIRAYPTTLIINKKGALVKVHTGFTGPATGAYYDAFKEKFNLTIKNLLSE